MYLEVPVPPSPPPYPPFNSLVLPPCSATPAYVFLVAVAASVRRRYVIGR
ncbi:hypothetical protein COCCADRAFT_100351 [Bipolaris zeicola 26-R-13]|uniref:Uncharacterized protein n=1 Tax=Cochliobolus carbonum (strain 26-R-13) TaxID=930089 RepID=W6Y2H8_COCC2|nr:uncharacterized protein COCCADRAFT_100351 [Bipolaris zeicola 26-R-13]EUC31825.1 hypothetical protein COCCADRAFT_100351 [Bipolaris zeicola 26-R-13]